MVTAFVDMVGLLIVVPLLPFYATRLGGGGFMVGLLVASFSVAQLLSAPLWGRVSDRFGRRPALLVGLGSAAVAYVIFAYADSLWLLLLSRVVQGAGGGTVGVVQAYVADATEPENRARALGWLSAASNLGVMIGPVLGSLTYPLSVHAPGLAAAGLCTANLIFAWRFLGESHDDAARAASAASGLRVGTSREALSRVLMHAKEPAPRLIWIYAMGMGAFHSMTAILALFLAAQHGVTEREIGYFFAYVGAIGVVARAGILGWAVDRLGEARLSRIGSLLLAIGLFLIPLTQDLVSLAIAVAFVPMGTAFLFPCVTALLSRVIRRHERGLYMGVQQTYGGIARVFGPLLGGLAYERFHATAMPVPFWGASVVVLLTIVLGLGLRPTEERSEVKAL